MRLTVLGCSPVQPNPGEACSGYLLQVGERCFLVDAGSGVIAALLSHRPLAGVDSVFITHAHPDHCQDLVTLRQCLAHGPGPSPTLPLPVYASAETIGTLRRVGAAFADTKAGAVDFWAEWIDFREVDAGSHLALEDLAVRFAETKHYVPTLALRCEANGRSVVFGADSGPCAALSALAEGVDLLLLEATLAQREGAEHEWGHMTPEEAGEMAARAGAGALRLVHYFISDDMRRIAAAASTRFDGDVRAARPGDVYVL